jgi:hypothetical protein
LQYVFIYWYAQEVGDTIHQPHCSDQWDEWLRAMLLLFLVLLLLLVLLQCLVEISYSVPFRTAADRHLAYMMTSYASRMDEGVHVCMYLGSATSEQ